ncbi:MAG: copper resistance protein CopC [Dehalococcoidia bacterium]|jgi:copper transport protein
MRRVFLLALLLSALTPIVLLPQSASAHAALRSSDPVANAFLQRAPGQITLTFTEPIDSRTSTVRLLDATGKPIQTQAPSVSGISLTATLPQLPPGIYNVLWSNTSKVDGHAISGSFPFTVLKADGSLPDQSNSVTGLSSDPDPQPLADGVAVRALSLLGLEMVVAGAMVILLWREAPVGVRRGLTYAVYAGATVLAVATILNLATIHDAYSGVSLRDIVLKTPSGGYWLTRAGLVLLVAVSATFLTDAPRRASGALLAATAVYLWAYTATSHAAAGAGNAWAKPLDVTHGAAALAWIGAVTGLALSARLGSREHDWTRLMPRFSLLASTTVFILLATGVMSAFVEIDHPEKLWQTRYGVTLLVKVGLMLPLLLLAAYNARYGKHLLERHNDRSRARFIQLATGEVTLGLAVFLAAAFLTQTTVSKSVSIQQDAKAFDQTSAYGDLNINLKIDPNRTGLNTYRISLTGANGAPVSADRVRLTFRYQDDATVGASSLVLSSSAGAYIGQGPFMTLEGKWRLETEVRRPDVDDVVGFFDVRPTGAAVSNVTAGGAWGNPAPGLTWNQFGGFIFLLAGFGFALSRGSVRRILGREAGWATSGFTMAGFSFGVLLVFGVHSHQVTGDIPSNPISGDANSIAQGRTLFEQNCASCHGRTGVPPKGLDLNPYPLDLTVHAPQHPDGQLFNFISKGVPGSAMRAWGSGEGKLTEEQIWHLVNYLRTLTPVER